MLFASSLEAPNGAYLSGKLPVKRLKQQINGSSPLIWTSRLRTGGTGLAESAWEVPNFRSQSLISLDRHYYTFCSQRVDDLGCRLRPQVKDQSPKVFRGPTPECPRSNHRRYGEQGSKPPLACHGTPEGRQLILAYGNMD